MNNQLVYFCKALGCNGEILFALKNCAFNLSNKATSTEQLQFIDHIGSFCKTWEYSSARVSTEYHGETPNGHNVKIQWEYDTVVITIDNLIISKTYLFRFESDNYWRGASFSVVNPIVQPQVKIFNYANDVKNILMNDLRELNKT